MVRVVVEGELVPRPSNRSLTSARPCTPIGDYLTEADRAFLRRGLPAGMLSYYWVDGQNYARAIRSLKSVFSALQHGLPEAEFLAVARDAYDRDRACCAADAAGKKPIRGKGIPSTVPYRQRVQGGYIQ